MGYLGSSLDDYYAYQLLEKVIEQLESGTTGSREKLLDRLNRLNNILNARDQDHRRCAWEIVESDCVGGDDTDFEKLVGILRDHYGQAS